MKAIFKLFILNLLALALLPSCSDDDQSNSEQNDPISGNISPVGSFAVEATNNENELLVKWTNPSNRDVDMVELSYRDVEASLSRATDFSPGHIIIQVERDVTQESSLFCYLRSFCRSYQQSRQAIGARKPYYDALS